MGMIPLMQYAKKHKKDPCVVRRRVQANRFRTARKYGAHWFIDENESYPPEKRRRSSRASLMKDRICEDCGVQFLGGALAKYCPACRRTRKLEYLRERREKSKEIH